MSSNPSTPTPTLNPHTTSSLTLLDHHHHQHHHHHPVTPITTAINPSSPSSSSSLAREYRKGNWTLHETLVLITAKRLDDERRTNRGGSIASAGADIKPGAAGGTPAQPQHCRSAELRWKWVENYCWRNGCLRSQNQCNDKWDNLLRDYKKVRDYEARCDDGKERPSYWVMEKHERKERNLPSNLASEVFEALTDVLSRRNANKTGGIVQAVAVVSRLPPVSTPMLPPPPPPAANHHQPVITAVSLPPPPPPPPVPTPPTVLTTQQQQQPQQQQPPQSPAPETSGSSESEAAGSEAKRRKKSGDLGSSVVRGASVLAQTILACEEKRDKRHRDLLELEERRLRMEEDRTEVSRQGVAGLIAAVNNLSGAIHALVSDHLRHNHHHPHNNDDTR